MTDLLWLDFIYRGITIRISWRELKGKNSKQMKEIADKKFEAEEKRLGRKIQ